MAATFALLGVLLAACGGTAPATTSPSATEAAATTSSPPPAPTTPSGPTPTSAADAARAVVDGLRSFATAGTSTYRITFTGDSRHAVDILDVAGTLDVSGADAAVTVTFDFPGQGTDRTDYRRIGNLDFVRVDLGVWRDLADVPAAEVVDVFSGARAASGIQYLGPVDGEPGHFRVQLAGTVLHPVLIPAANLTATAVKATTLTLVTDATGLPLSGTWTMHGEDRVSGQLQEVVMDLDLTFSKVNEPITIQAP